MKKKKENEEYDEEGFPLKVMYDPAVAEWPINARYTPLQIILGGKYKYQADDDLDLIKSTREGVTRDTLYSVAKYMGITLEEMASLLHTTYRNVVRKDANEHLDPLKSEKIIELAKFAQFGIEVLGNQENFKTWLRSDIMALGFKKPLEYLDTSFGVTMVTNILGRIQYGVYS